MRSNKHLKKYCKKTAKKINLKLLDRLRDTNKAKSSDAKGILNSVNKGKKILTTEKAISEAVDKRAKRYGAVGSLFWRSAKELNPKIRSDGRISKDKMKKHKLTNGMTFKGKYENSTIDVKIRHKAGDNNSKFDSELTKRIDKQVTYWLDRAYKQIATKRYLGKHLDKI